MTSSTIPRVIQVVPFPLLDTLERCFFETFVPARFSAIGQLNTDVAGSSAYSQGLRWKRREAISHLREN